MTTLKPRVFIFCDGSCPDNSHSRIENVLGSYAIILKDTNDRYKEIVGTEDNATNNRMELLAAIIGLETLKAPCTVYLHSDSEYVVFGINKRLKRWEKRNWTGIQNVDLWKRISALLLTHDVKAFYASEKLCPEIKRCDILAKEQSRAKINDRNDQ